MLHVVDAPRTKQGEAEGRQMSSTAVEQGSVESTVFSSKVEANPQ